MEYPSDVFRQHAGQRTELYCRFLELIIVIVVFRFLGNLLTANNYHIRCVQKRGGLHCFPSDASCTVGSVKEDASIRLATIVSAR